MHPLFKTPRNLFYALSGWALIAMSFIVLQYSILDCSWRGAFILSTPPLVVLFFILLSNFFIARAISLKTDNLYLQVLKHIAAAIIIMAFWLQLTMLYTESLVLFSGDVSWRELFSNSLALYTSAGLLIYSVVILLHYLYLESEYVHQVEQQAMEIKLNAAKSELNALKLSVHPHFLFNSFNVLNTLILKDAEKASQVTLKLSDFLRKSLSYSETDWTTLQEELEHIQDYLDLEQTRLGDRLQLNFKIDKHLKKMQLPPFTLLPVIENAVKHGIEQSVQGGVISLTVREENEKLFCLVTNPCPQSVPESKRNGFGLRALSKRLDAAYDSTITLNKQKNGQIFALSFYLPMIPESS